MKLQLSLPVTPYKLNQAFGGNPQYYAKFLDAKGNAMKGHMGTDLMAVHGQPVYAPCDGMAFYVTDPHGGDGVYVQADGMYDFEGGQAYMQIIHWHLCSKDDPKYKFPIPAVGSNPVKKGDLLGYADNTGAPYESSGDHLHWALLPSNGSGKPIRPDNGYGGCIDIMPYWDGTYAPDITITGQIVKNVIQVETLIPQVNLPPAITVSLWEKVVEILKALLTK